MLTTLLLGPSTFEEAVNHFPHAARLNKPIFSELGQNDSSLPIIKVVNALVRHQWSSFLTGIGVLKKCSAVAGVTHILVVHEIPAEWNLKYVPHGTPEFHTASGLVITMCWVIFELYVCLFSIIYPNHCSLDCAIWSFPFPNKMVANKNKSLNQILTHRCLFHISKYHEYVWIKFSDHLIATSFRLTNSSYSLLESNYKMALCHATCYKLLIPDLVCFYCALSFLRVTCCFIVYGCLPLLNWGGGREMAC